MHPTSCSSSSGTLHRCHNDRSSVSSQAGFSKVSTPWLLPASASYFCPDSNFLPSVATRRLLAHLEVGPLGHYSTEAHFTPVKYDAAPKAQVSKKPATKGGNRDRTKKRARAMEHWSRKLKPWKIPLGMIRSCCGESRSEPFCLMSSFHPFNPSCSLETPCPSNDESFLLIEGPLACKRFQLTLDSASPSELSAHDHLTSRIWDMQALSWTDSRTVEDFV